MFDTVIGHVQAGRVRARTRKSADDFELAATWLEQYEADSEDDAALVQSLATMAGWLRKQAAKKVSDNF